MSESNIFKLLSDSQRWKILVMFRNGRTNTGEIAERLGIVSRGTLLPSRKLSPCHASASHCSITSTFSSSACAICSIGMCMAFRFMAAVRLPSLRPSRRPLSSPSLRPTALPSATPSCYSQIYLLPISLLSGKLKEGTA